MARPTTSSAASLLAIVLIACAPDPADPPELPELATWREDVGPLFQEACATCHAGEAAEAGYSVEAYLEAIGPARSAERMAVAGDESSPLLLRLAEADHGAHLADDALVREHRLRLVRHWVVHSRLAYFRSEAHPPGILDGDAADFHGRAVAAADWRMAACRDCHGADYAGDTGPTCLSCHPATPEACGTCHSGPDEPPPFRGLRGPGDAPRADAGTHDAHVHGGPVSVGTPCTTCHPPRPAVDAEDHRSGSVTLRFGGVAGVAGLSPTWDATSRTCSGTWCHGAGLEDPNEESPPWEAHGAVPCGTCHTLPPETLSTGGPHPEVETCGGCHGMVIDDDWAWVDRARHVDGTIDR